MIGFIKFIAGLLIGHIMTEIQNRYRGEILYLCRNEELIIPKGVGIQDVQILYKQQPIESLSVAKILIVNNSQHVLEKRDLDNEGLCIKTTGKADILRIDWQSSTDTDNVYELPVSTDKKSVAIKFHHLNPGNAWLFQVFHTGESSHSITCSCSAAGITNTRRISIEGRSIWELLFFTPVTTNLYINYCRCKSYMLRKRWVGSMDCCFTLAHNCSISYEFRVFVGIGLSF